MPFQPLPGFSHAPKSGPPGPPVLQHAGPTNVPPNPFAGFEAANNASPPGLRDPVLQGRFGVGISCNRTTISGRKLLSVTVDRPTIVYPLTVPANFIYYQTAEMPNWNSATAPPANTALNPLFRGQRSSGCGICYLHTTGMWHLWYDVNAAVLLDILLVPAEDPGVATKYLAEPGCHLAVNTNLALVANTVSTIVANRDRKAFFLQNLSGGSSLLRIGMGTALTAASVGVPPAGNGYAIANLGTFELSGDSCYRGAITLVIDAAGEVEYTEFS